MRRIFALLLLCFISVLFIRYAESAAYLKKSDSFSFLVFGDNRLPGHVPYTEDEADKIADYFQQIKAYAYGSDVKTSQDMGFDPKTKKLQWIKVWPTMLPDKYSIIVYGDGGWPALMVRGMPPQIALRPEGQAWVYENMLKDLHKGVKTRRGPTFAISTGDITYNGLQGKGRDHSPYWKDFYERFMKKLPKGKISFSKRGRVFPAPGNHETWGDEDLVGFRQTFPYLDRLGFNEKNRIYSFDHKGSRFIFLDTGDMDYHNPAAWGGKHPDFEGQMKALTKWLEGAKNKGLNHVFITYHNPSFCRAGFGPLPDGHNPHPYIKPYAKDLNIVVLNGHVHTTEAYEVDGIKYLVLGGGGGEQGFVSNEMPEDYPQDLYWKGNPRVEDYNYLLVEVNGKDVKFTLKRFRPTAKTKYEEVPLYR